MLRHLLTSTARTRYLFGKSNASSAFASSHRTLSQKKDRKGLDGGSNNSKDNQRWKALFMTAARVGLGSACLASAIWWRTSKCMVCNTSDRPSSSSLEPHS